MPIIKLETFVRSDAETCFDLSRSIDLHQVSTAATKERAVAGVTHGLINLNETVTWEAIHFGIKQQLTSRITKFNRPFYFQDVLVKGAFESFTHDHYFEQVDGGIKMTDVFNFTSPLGIPGKMADKIFLTAYMRRLLSTRNDVIKQYAESGQWKSMIG